jgi:hypothetical protein
MVLFLRILFLWCIMLVLKEYSHNFFSFIKSMQLHLFTELHFTPYWWKRVPNCVKPHKRIWETYFLLKVSFGFYVFLFLWSCASGCNCVNWRQNKWLLLFPSIEQSNKTRESLQDVSVQNYMSIAAFDRWDSAKKRVAESIFFCVIFPVLNLYLLYLLLFK